MHWKLAASPFVVGIPANATTCYGSSLFHRIPGAPEAGGPTHMISANSGAVAYVGTYDSKLELMTVVGGRQTLDSSTNYQWAAAGTNGPNPETDSGRLLTVAWVRAGGSGRVPCMAEAGTGKKLFCCWLISCEMTWVCGTDWVLRGEMAQRTALRWSHSCAQSAGTPPPGSWSRFQWRSMPCSATRLSSKGRAWAPSVLALASPSRSPAAPAR